MASGGARGGGVREAKQPLLRSGRSGLLVRKKLNTIQTKSTTLSPKGMWVGRSDPKCGPNSEGLWFGVCFPPGLHNLSASNYSSPPPWLGEGGEGWSGSRRRQAGDLLKREEGGGNHRQALSMKRGGSTRRWWCEGVEQSGLPDGPSGEVRLSLRGYKSRGWEFEDGKWG